jgi:hypothetical protein
MSSAALPSFASLPLKAAGFHELNLRRIVYTPQSALLPHTTAGSSMRRLASNTLLVPRIAQNHSLSLLIKNFDDGFWPVWTAAGKV